MKLRLLTVVLAVLGINCGKKSDVYRITHANGKPCAAGLSLVKGFFTEQDGTREDACFPGSDRHLDITHERFELDVRKPGESLQITLPVLLPAEQGKH